MTNIFVVRHANLKTFCDRNGKQPSILSNFSDDSSKKDGPTTDKTTTSDKSEKNDNKKEVTSKRLNDLLAMMSTETDLTIIKSVIKPKAAAVKREQRMAKTVRNDEEDQEDSSSDNIAEAAKEVAKTLGGDTKNTESELLSILLKSSEENGDRNLKYGNKFTKLNSRF